MNPAIFSAKLAKKFSATVMAFTVLLSLSGCDVAPTTPLWRNNLQPQETVLEQGTLVNATGETYQSFRSGNDLQLRKLTAAGVEAWRITLGDSLNDVTYSIVTAEDNGVALLSATNEVTRVDSDGAILWRRQVVPDGATITAITPSVNGIFFVAYQNTTSGIISVAVDAGAEHWQHTFAEAANLQLAPRSTGHLLAMASRNNSRAVTLHVFDAQGNAVQQQDMQLSSASASKKLFYRHDQAFILSSSQLYRLNASGEVMWQHGISQGVQSCTAGDDGATACWYQHFPIIGVPSPETLIGIVWIDAEGNERQHYGRTLGLDSFNQIKGLHYSGDKRRWILEERVDRPRFSAIPPDPREYHEYSRFSVYSDAGNALRTITLKTVKSMRCVSCNYPDEYFEDGDDAVALVTDSGLYASGNTRKSRQGFVSAYRMP